MAADDICTAVRAPDLNHAPIIDEALAAFAARWSQEWKAVGGYLAVQPDGRKCITYPIKLEDPDRERRTRLLSILDDAGRDARDAVFHLSRRVR